MSQTKKKSTGKKSNIKKGRVTIPAFKVIILCAAIIVVCLGLLLLANILSLNNDDKPATNIAERFEDTTEISADDNLESENPAQTENLNAQSTVPAAKETSVRETPETQVQPQVSDTKKTETTAPAVQKPAASVSSVNASSAKPPVQPPQQPAQTQVTQNFGFPKAVNGAQLVFLFDDGGQSLKDLEPFLKLPFPVTIAVLPQLIYSKESAEQIRKAGKELMLHQPMQAINLNTNPGKGAITPDMSESQIKSTLFKNINEIGPIAGLNNHEGSLITADADKMAVILQYANEQGIFFLDSRTNVDTKVPYVAGEMGYSYYERNGRFLDNEKTRQNALTELKKNLDIANKNGVVIMIGHVWSAGFLPDLLQDVYPELKEKGYTFKTVSNCKGVKY